MAVSGPPESDGNDDVGEDDDPPPHPPREPSPPTVDVSTAGPQVGSSSALSLARSLRSARRKMQEGEAKFKKVERRWLRKMSYIHDRNGSHSLWRSDSEVQRDYVRLINADHEMCEARLSWFVRRLWWLRLRSHAMCCGSAFVRTPTTPCRSACQVLQACSRAPIRGQSDARGVRHAVG